MERAITQESRLLDRARRGEAKAFDDLFALHQDRVRAGIWNLLGGDRELVEEAVGLVFLRAFLAFPQFRRQCAFSTWLFRIAVREAQALRRKMTKDRNPLTLDADCREISRTLCEDPASYLLKIEEERRVRQALLALPEPYRTPVRLRYIETWTAVEIARHLQRPEGTVRYQISRGLKILRERFI
jgi:RNA polymerase sigma-70 factor (ECF subfamily)